MKVEFGALVPCRECHGAGEVRHRANKDESRRRAAMQRKGIALEPVPTMDVCPVCMGKGYLPPAEADHR